MKSLRALWAVLCLFSALLSFSTPSAAQAVSLPPSKRVTINMGHMPWKFLVGQDPNGAQNPSFDDSAWTVVGLPNSADQLDTFTNQASGGGAGELTGNTVWYRRRFQLDPQFANSKVQVVFEGAHTGVQVYINGHFLQGTQPFAPQATHVVGFLPFVVDLTPYVNVGSDNVIAVRISRNADWFPSPGFSQAFRFGQADNGIFRPVYMEITDKVHIPENIYSGSNAWGTYVATQSATDDSASIRVQTNVVNEGAQAREVTLTTQIVNASGSIVATRQDTKMVTPGTAAAPQPVLFDETLTVDHPTLWYPNNSLYGKPYLYKVFHIVSIDGVVVDTKQSPLGIRTVTWDKDFVYVNGKMQKFWGASGRYDYPGLGTSVPEEQKWRDLQQMAAMGGNLWRPGHSAEGEAFLNAADALGIMVMQPSGDGENGFSDPCGPDAKMTCEQEQLKMDLHRDMIVAYRNHPSVLAWEADNGVTLPAFAQQLAAIGKQWDYLGNDGAVNGTRGGRPQSDRAGGNSIYANSGDFMSCSGQGCEIGVKDSIPDKPAWGAEYWGPGVIRQDHDHEISMAAQYIDSWSKGIAKRTFGLSQWYFADSPGEIGTYTDLPETQEAFETERSIGDSMVDFERFPRLLYYIEGANWTPYAVRPIVKLAHTWNRSGNIQVNAWSNCPAVRLLINGKVQGGDQVPNPWSSIADNDADFAATEKTTKLAGQVHWNVTWEAGTATAACVDAAGIIVRDAQGNTVADTLTTAGAPDHLVLENVPNVIRPDGTSFQVTANATDAAFVTAKVVDANGVVVPDASNLITFAVTGPATYVGGTQQMVTAGKPRSYHAPGDPELAAEGGLQKIAIKSTFTPGVVTVSATSPGLAGASTSFEIHPIPQENNVAAAPIIVAQPIDTAVTQGYSAHFSAAVSGAAPLTFQWFKNGQPLANSNAATLDTGVTAVSDNHAVFAVEVSNNLGSVRSNNAVLTVVTPSAPALGLQPAATTVDSGNTATFTVQATGSPTLQYQWSRNGIEIPGAVGQSYTTPVLGIADSGVFYSVTVRNPVGSIRSADALLTVNAAVAPIITTQPVDVAALPGQPATFSATVSGSTPLVFAWRHDGTIVGGNSPTLTISAVSNGDLGNYTLTATNSAGSATSNTVALTLAPPGVNLSLGKTGLGSSFEDPVGLASKYAIDGDQTTRWGSAFSDPQSYQIDFAAPMTFNRVVLDWDNAYASQYTLQVSNDDQNWTEIPNLPSSIGRGGHEDYAFTAQHARYLRMYGTVRNTGYGYSIHEFAVYNAPAVGGSNERWTIGQDSSSLVTDNLSGLIWTRTQKTDNTAGAQFTQTSAINYCQTLGMRIPTLAEALAISGTSASSAAFPAFWATWTSTDAPTDATRAYNVDSTGNVFFGIKTNSPGATLCVSGATQQAPAITQQPMPVTAQANATATFTVTATPTPGNGSATYTWLKNDVPFQITAVPSVTTPLLTAADNGALYSVVVTGANGLTATSGTAVLTVQGTATPPPDNPGNGNPGNGNPGNGNPPPTSPGTGPAPVGTNYALAGTATASSSENPGNLGAAMVNDGDLTTRWGSEFSDPQWIQIDLGSPRQIGEVQLVWENAYSTQYQVQIPDGNGGWKQVDNPQGMTFQGGTENITFTPVTTQLIRVLGLARHTQYGHSLFEFGVYGPVLPVIQTQPVGQTVNSGSAAQFSVVATGVGQLSYQWFRNGVVIDGATAPAYTTPTLTSADSGASFTVQVKNLYGTVLSSAATVTVNVIEPVAGVSNLALGKVATSSGDENGGLGAYNAIDGDLTTRWSSEFKDNAWLQVDLGQSTIVNKAILRWEAAYGKSYLIQYSNDGASWQTAASQPEGTGGQETLTFPSVFARYIRLQGVARFSQYGYSLFEFELYGADVPSITAQPANQTANAGATATFTVAAAGSGTLRYQWLRNGVAISGATSSSYTTPTLMTQDNGSVFSVTVSNANGGAESKKATLTVNAGDPAGTNLALNATTSSSGDENGGVASANAVDGSLNTRWSSNFADNAWFQVDLGSPKSIAQVQINWENAYGTAYLIQVSNDQANWNPVFTQNAGKGSIENITFSPVTARFVRMQGVKRSSQYGYSFFEFAVYGSGTGGGTGTAPSITTQPVSQTANVGGTVTFTVVAAGTGPLTYQWFRNGAAIEGAQTASYTTPKLTTSDQGSKYTVTVGNSINTVTSQAATLSIVGAGPGYTIYPGFLGVDLNNNTHGRWTDDEIYVTVIGIDPRTPAQADGKVPTKFATVRPDGTIVDVDQADNTAQGAWNKNGKTYPNYSFTLAQANHLLKLPPITSGRIFISMGQPVYLTAYGERAGAGNTSYAGPNPQNATDPNIDVPYDWYEFNYDGPGHTIYINTTQVDQFGLPLTLDVWGANATFHQQVGITESIAQLDQEFLAETPAEFHAGINALRIPSPTKTNFAENGPNSTYFDDYTSTLWNKHSTTPLVMSFSGRTFSGTTSGGDTFSFVDPHPPAGLAGNVYLVRRPTTQQIFQCDGTMAQGASAEQTQGKTQAQADDLNATQLQIQAHFCGTLNRHILDNDSSTWGDPATYYGAAPANFYSQFWHRHSIAGLAYGFAYDDQYDWSSTIHNDAPEHMAFGIGW